MIPARSGDWTRPRNRVSRSAGSVRAGAAVLARRALKVKSSIVRDYVIGRKSLVLQGPKAVPLGLSAFAFLVILRLIALDQLLHRAGIALVVAVAANRVRAAARLDQQVREERTGIALHGRDILHV